MIVFTTSEVCYAGVGTIGSDRKNRSDFFERVTDPIQFFRRVHRSDLNFFSNVPTPGAASIVFESDWCDHCFESEIL